MKYITILSLWMGLSGAAIAHGSKAEQAVSAIQKASELFSTQPKEIQRDFQSVSALITGHERFTVTIALKNNSKKFDYDCTEDESGEPVLWECKQIAE